MTRFFMFTWWGDSQNMREIEFSWWLFEGRPRQGKNVLPDGLNWLCYFAGNSKGHREYSISFIFLESPHQVGMKNLVKCYKHFFGYFNALKTHGDCIKSEHIGANFLPWIWTVCWSSCMLFCFLDCKSIQGDCFTFTFGIFWIQGQNMRAYVFFISNHIPN